MSDDRLIRIENKLDHVVEKISNIDVTLARQEEQIKIHIKRTNLLEEQIKPVQEHVGNINAILKLIGIAAMIGAIIEGGVSLLTYLRK